MPGLALLAGLAGASSRLTRSDFRLYLVKFTITKAVYLREMSVSFRNFLIDKFSFLVRNAY